MSARIIISVLVSCVLILSVSCESVQNSDESIVDDLIGKMTIDEKISQMRVFHANLGISLDDNDSLILSDKVKEKLKNGIAGIKNPGEHYSPGRAAILNNKLQKYIIENTRLKVPAFFITESYNGVDAKGCTRFARPISLASTWNDSLVYRVYDCMGKEARLRGLHLTHSPEADIVRDPRFGRMSETFGEDTHLVTEMIVNAVNGLQGLNKGLASTHIGAVVKHFAGYAQVAGGRNFASVEMSPLTLFDEILPPFKAAVQRSGALGIMASHGDINGVSCHSNSFLLNDILRESWGFKGYVISDSNDINRLYSFMHTAETEEEAVIMALKAGVDIDLYSEKAYSLLPSILKKYPELIEYVDKAVRRVLSTKVKLGLFDDPYANETQFSQVRDTSAVYLAKKADEESIILLKNSNSILPLTRFMTVALVGPTLSEHTEQAFVNVADGRCKFVSEKGFHLTNQQGIADGDGDGSGEIVDVQLTPENSVRKGIDRILQVVRNADIVILFVGGDSFTSREAFFNNALGDRSDINLVGLQDELINKVCALGKPVVGVLKHRRTLSVVNLSEKVNALLDCWELSEFGDEAIARVLFGDVNPSGKLPVTVPRTIGQLPFHYSQKAINDKKGYLFVENSPLYPFGYGISYTSFNYSNLSSDKDEYTFSENVNVSVDVTNIGKSGGNEIVQLYIRDPYAKVLRPDKLLKGFKKVWINPGETVKVSFCITPEMFEYTLPEMKSIIDPGEYEVMIGGNSTELLNKKIYFKE